jgi:hypothetical protein
MLHTVWAEHTEHMLAPHTHRPTCCCGCKALPHSFGHLVHPLLACSRKLCQRAFEQLEGRLLG